MPGVKYKSDLGVGVSVPFYIALVADLRPDADRPLLFEAGLPRPGRMAAALQQRLLQPQGRRHQPAGSGRIRRSADEDSGTADDPEHAARHGRHRRACSTSIRAGRSAGTCSSQSDKNFSNTYGIGGFERAVHRSEVYLTGLNDRNYFDLRAMHFEVQEDSCSTATPLARNDKQPWVLPSFDYSYTPDEPVAGGELNINVNAREIVRDELDFGCRACRWCAASRASDGRVTAEAEWKKSIVTEGGMVITPAARRARRRRLCRHERRVRSPPSTTWRPRWAWRPTSGPSSIATWRRPVSNGAGRCCSRRSARPTSLEPMAQVFARPDEQYIGELGIPNEDAQSFVFDAVARLFERDKFSGYDRMEGGTRVNRRRALLRRLRQRLDDQRDPRPVLPGRRRELVRRAGPGQCRRLFRAWRRRPPTMSAWSASRRRSACRRRSAPASTSRPSSCGAPS